MIFQKYTIIFQIKDELWQPKKMIVERKIQTTFIAQNSKIRLSQKPRTWLNNFYGESNLSQVEWQSKKNKKHRNLTFTNRIPKDHATFVKL